MKSVKYSRQREAVKAYVMQAENHPSAENIYEAIRETYPKISLGTVYRNLTLLAQRGEIAKIRLHDGIDRYDGNLSRHYHFVCRICGGVQDLTMLPIDHIEAIAGEHLNGTIEGHFAYFYGVCRDCDPEKRD